VAVCEAAAKRPITVVPAGRAVGKSCLLAGLVLWWIYTRPKSLVITTGPDFRQVVSVLWKELRSAAVPLGYDHLTHGYGTPQRLTVQQGTGWGALGFAAQYEEGFSGQHAGDLLVIVDEASGISAPIWSPIYGLAATRL
jgi:tRNA(Met) C34 N-acetyltransferase TmcA